MYIITSGENFSLCSFLSFLGLLALFRIIRKICNWEGTGFGSPLSDVLLFYFQTNSHIFVSCARWKGEVWYQCRHYEKLIVSFSFHLTQCYYLRIFTEAGYIFLFINYDRALRPLRDNFWCHVVGLAKHSSMVCYIGT